MAAAKWQQANGAKQCENGRPKKVRNRHPKQCENKRKSAKTKTIAKTIENRQKSAKTIGVFFVVLAISRGHIAVAILVFPSTRNGQDSAGEVL